MSKKKIIIIALIVFLGLDLAYLSYLLFFRPKPIVGPPVISPTPTARLPEISPGAITPGITPGQSAFPLGKPSVTPEASPLEEGPLAGISEIAQGGRTWINPITAESVLDPVLSTDGTKSYFYSQKTGQFFELTPDGQKKSLTDQVFYQVKKIDWSPDRSKAIIEYPDNFKILYDFQQKKQYSLPNNWSDFSWNPYGDKIAFKIDSKYPEERWLAVSRPDGTMSQLIEPMGENADKVVVSWSPNNQIIAFSATGEPRGLWEQEILPIGLYGENFRSIIVDGRNFQPKWSPAGDKIVYSVYNQESNFQPKLYLVEAEGDRIGANKKDLGLTTWAEKCAFNQSGTYLYCAVPRNLPEGAGLLPALAENTIDDFYQIDVATGWATFLAEAVGGYNVQNPYLSADEKYLYFTDKNIGFLRSVRLK